MRRSTLYMEKNIRAVVVGGATKFFFGVLSLEKRKYSCDTKLD